MTAGTQVSADLGASAPPQPSAAAPTLASRSADSLAHLLSNTQESAGRTRVGVILSLCNVALYSILALSQWVGWGGFYAASDIGQPHLIEALLVILVNFAYGLAVIVGVSVLRPMARPLPKRIGLIALVALVASGPRMLALIGISTTPDHATFVLAEGLAGFVAGFVAVGAGMLAASLISRIRNEQTSRLAAANAAARAVEELQTEEMRVRRMVADQLHGNLQYHLVSVTAGLDGVAATLDQTGQGERAQEVQALAERLEAIREQEVRALSHAVFPAGVEISAVRAIEVMLRRLPPQIATTLTIGPTARRILTDEGGIMPLAERLVAVYTVEEAVTNALKHGQANSLDLRGELLPLSGGRWELVMTVDDNGTGLAEDDLTLSGLVRHRDRLNARGGTLTLVNRPTGGTRLAFTLPFVPDPNPVPGPSSA